MCHVPMTVTVDFGSLYSDMIGAHHQVPFHQFAAILIHNYDPAT